MSSRRDFLRRSLGLGLPSDDAEAWAEVEARAAQFGIVPGTRVDASGALVAPSLFGDEPYLGEIFYFAFDFAPQNYAFCNGQLLLIAENQALFALLGTTYGGNGVTTVGLPDLRGRIPMHMGQGPGLSNRTLGEVGGVEAVTLLTSNLPAHTHTLSAASVGTRATPVDGSRFAPLDAGRAGYAADATASWPSGSTGSSQPHANMPPVLVLNACIVLSGIFPSRN